MLNTGSLNLCSYALISQNWITSTILCSFWGATTTASSFRALRFEGCHKRSEKTAAFMERQGWRWASIPIGCSSNHACCEATLWAGHCGEVSRVDYWPQVRVRAELFMHTLTKLCSGTINLAGNDVFVFFIWLVIRWNTRNQSKMRQKIISADPTKLIPRHLVISHCCMIND